MGNLLSQNPSPTLGEQQQKNCSSAKIAILNRKIEAASSIYRNKDAAVVISSVSQSSGEETVLILSELPDELRQALHDYATRLIGERHQLQA